MTPFLTRRNALCQISLAAVSMVGLAGQVTKPTGSASKPKVTAKPKPPSFKSDAVVPRFANTLSGTRIDGKPFRLLDHYGKVVGLEFALPGCPHCQETAQHLESIYRDYAKSGFTAICVLVDSNSAEKAAAFATEQKLTFPVVALQGPEVVREFLGLQLKKQSIQMPQVAFLDRWHRIRYQFDGENPILARQAILESFGLVVSALVAERPSRIRKR